MKKEFILSIETSGNLLGIGITDTKEVIAKVEYFMPNLHDRLLAKTVKEIMQDLKISFEEIKAVAVSAGPGSFTGLRIGLAFAKALCFDESIKFIPVPVLDAFAFTASEYINLLDCKKIIATVPSHKNLLYFREYDKDLNPLSEILMEEYDTFTNLDFSDTLLIGEFSRFESNYKTIGHLNSLIIENIMAYANKQFINNNFTNPSEFIPIYVQDFVPKGYKN